MSQYQVTVDGEVLQQLFVRDDGLPRLAEQVLNQILEAQATEQLQAKPYERTEERQGYRNGHRDKPLNTRVGRLVLSVPRLRSGEFSPDLNEMSAQRLIGAVLMEIDGDWTTGHRYFDMEEHWAWRAEQEAKGEEGTSDVNHDNRT